MKTYKILLSGIVSRSVLVNAESIEDANKEGVREFAALTGAQWAIKIIDIEEKEVQHEH